MNQGIFLLIGLIFSQPATALVIDSETRIVKYQCSRDMEHNSFAAADLSQILYLNIWGDKEAVTIESGTSVNPETNQGLRITRSEFLIHKKDSSQAFLRGGLCTDWDSSNCTVSIDADLFKVTKEGQVRVYLKNRVMRYRFNYSCELLFVRH